MWSAFGGLEPVLRVEAVALARLVNLDNPALLTKSNVIEKTVSVRTK